MATESNYKGVFENFAELSANVIKNDVEMAKEFLKEFDIDPDKETAKGLQQIRKIHFLTQAHEKQSRDESLLKQLQDKLKESIQKNVELTGAVLQSMLKDKQVSFQFRNLEKWTEDEMREVLQDLDLVQLLEELDKLEE